MPTELIEPMTQFGVAGLMGALWVWERNLSRKREKQLGEAHERMVQDRQYLRALVKLVKRNTQAIDRFEQTQHRLMEVLAERCRFEEAKAAGYGQQPWNTSTNPSPGSSGSPSATACDGCAEAPMTEVRTPWPQAG